MALTKFFRPRVRATIIEDDETTRELLVRLLSSMGAEAFGFPDGMSGLLSVFTAPRDKRPDLVISDLNLGGLDGLAVLGALKTTLDSEIASIPVVLFTASSDAVIAERAKKAGCACTLTKPFSPASLSDVLAKIIERTDAKRVGMGPSSLVSMPSARIGTEMPRTLPR